MARHVSLDPDFVFDVPGIATDQRLVDRIGEIRVALADTGFLSLRPSAHQYRDVLTGTVQILAFVGATPEQAAEIALDLGDQLQGSEVEIHHVIHGIDIEILADEPVDEQIDATTILFDGEPLVTATNRRTALVDVDADWPALAALADRTLLA